MADKVEIGLTMTGAQKVAADMKQVAIAAEQAAKATQQLQSSGSAGAAGGSLPPGWVMGPSGNPILDPSRFQRGWSDADKAKYNAGGTPNYDYTGRRPSIIGQDEGESNRRREAGTRDPFSRDRVFATGNLGRVMGVAIGAHFASRAFEAGTEALVAEQGERNPSLGRAFVGVAREMMNSIPVIGGFTRGLGNLASVMDGSAARLAEVSRQREKLEIEGRANAERRNANEQHDHQVRQIERAHADATAGAASAQWLSAAVGNPETLARLTRAAQFGVVNADTGTAELGVLNARAGVMEAEQIAAQRRNEKPQPGEWDLSNLNSRIFQQEDRVRRGSNIQQNLESDRFLGIFGAPNDIRSEVATKMMEARQKLLDLEAEKRRTLASLMERETAHMQSQVNLAQRRHDLAIAELNMRKNDAALLDERKSGAVQLGMMDEGSIEQALAAYQMLKQNGLAGLSPTDRGAIQSMPGGSQLLEPFAIDAASKRPAAQEWFNIIGAGQISGAADFERQRREIAEQIIRGTVEANEALKASIAAAQKEWVTSMKDMLTESFANAISQIRTESRQALDKAFLQAR